MHCVACQWPKALSTSTLTGLHFTTVNNPPGVSLRLSSDSNTNAKKWETELQTLRENNARLVDALQESSANVESWKKQLSVCKEESDTLRQKVKTAYCTAQSCRSHWYKWSRVLMLNKTQHSQKVNLSLQVLLIKFVK